MANIVHRLSIDAPPARVRELIATKHGIQRWWTGRPVDGNDGHGGELRVYFGDNDRPAAVFEVAGQTADEILWRCIDGTAGVAPDTDPFSSAPVRCRRHHAPLQPRGLARGERVHARLLD